MEKKHKCNFIQKSKDIYICSICSTTHTCGSLCDSLQYNKDYTNVCQKTGICYEQKLCDEFYDANRNIIHTFDTDFENKTNKASQSHSMRKISLSFIETELKKLIPFIKISEQQQNSLTEQLYLLWSDIVKTRPSLRRKDKRCFIVAIVFNLYKGIETSSGIVVHKHLFLHPPVFNKRTKGRVFDVSDIRTGQLFIRKVYSDRECPFPIDLN